MKYPTTTARVISKPVHKCLCLDKDYLHDPDTGECHGRGCSCTRFSCKVHGPDCTAEGRFSPRQMTGPACRFEPFKVSERQTLSVCALCGRIDRGEAKACKGSRKTAKKTERPAIIVRGREQERAVKSGV